MVVVRQFTLPSSGVAQMPNGAEVLRVEYVDGVVKLWALVWPGHPIRERVFLTVPAEHVLEKPPGKFVGSFIGCGSLVFVFEKFS